MVSVGNEPTRLDTKVVAITGCALGIAATFAPSFAVFRVNRIANGTAESALQALGPWGWLLAVLWLLAAVATLVPQAGRARGVACGVLAGAVPVIATWRLGAVAAAYLVEQGDVARVSLGVAYWVMLLAAYLVVFTALGWTRPGWRRALVAYAPLVGVAVLLLVGSLASLSILREYANVSEEFWAQVRLQLAYVLGATLGGLVIGLPLGMLAARRPATEPAVFGVLNVLEVLPVLAFIGLLNPVLTSLSEQVPLLEAMGVRGVGWAPVLLVLTAYAAYPIARNAYSAMTTLDRSVLDAARGVGMGRWRRLAEVELPLAMPVIVAGTRIALVQTTAGAIIAGLVGGGGLGTFVFLGAAQTATDLILLGTVPIVMMALFFDRSALALESLLNRWSLRT